MNSTPTPHGKIVASLADQYPLLGLALQHHRTQRGALSFADRPYLIEIYRDLPTLDEMAARKAVQTGWSEALIQFLLERAGWAGRTVAYVLPTSSMRDRFVQNRINPSMLMVPAYRDRLPGGGSKDAVSDGAVSVRSKAFGRGRILFLGSNSPGEFVEFSSDVAIVDELDLCDQQNLALLPDRLRASPYPQIVRIGNPTLPGKGISRAYDKGDRRRWHFRCDHCGERQHLEWEVHVVREVASRQYEARDAERANDPSRGDIRPVCRRCHLPFDRVGTGGGWVAEHPGRARSYTMSRLEVLSQSLRSLVDEWQDAQESTLRIETFYRSNLGIPFEVSDARLSVELMLAAATGPVLDPVGGDHYEPRIVTAGIDVGRVLNVCVSTVEREGRVLRWAGELVSFDDLLTLLRRYHVKTAVIDARPETRAAQTLRDRAKEYGINVWLCQFAPTDRVGREQYGMKQDWTSRLVTVDRTQLLDATYDDLRASPAKRILPSNIGDVRGFDQQMRAPRRVLDDKSGRYVWNEGNEADHYRFADAYDRVASDLAQRGGNYYVVNDDE